MIFTAYFDESDTHGPAPTIIMAGLLGTARQWELLGRRLRSMQEKHGFQVFHAKDVRGFSGEFAGWNQAKAMRLVQDLTDALLEIRIKGVTAHLEHERYINEYRAPPVPKKMHLDSQYGVCFRVCMGYLIERLLKDGKKHRLHAVIERGNVNAGDTDRIFNQLKGELRQNGIDLFGDITIIPKDESPYLMVADFLAHTYSLMKRPRHATAPTVVGTQGVAADDNGWTYLEILPDALRQLKNDYEVNKQLRASLWRKQRAATKEASSQGQPS